MIFSRRKPGRTGDVVSIFIPEAIAHAARRDVEAKDAWRKRTDTDGAERRARQTKHDNELL